MRRGPAIQDLVPRNECWGCGPTNKDGLQLKSYVEGDEVVAVWQPRPPYFAGPTHVLNGGIIAALFDCHSICTAIADVYQSEGREIGSKPDIWCATAALNISYRKPVSLFRLVSLRANVTDRSERRRTVTCTLRSDGEECARAEVVGVRVPESWRDPPAGWQAQ